MKNIIDLEKVKWDRKSQSYRDYVRGIVERIRDCATEEPAFQHGLQVVANSFEKYLDTLYDAVVHAGKGSYYWDPSCTLSFKGLVENDELVSVGFNVLNGRAVEVIDPNKPSELYQGSIILSQEKNTVRFTEHHNADPEKLFETWLEDENKKAGISLLYSINTTFFKILLRNAMDDGFKLDYLSRDDDRLTLAMVNRNERMSVVIDYAKFKSTHVIFIKKLQAAQNQSNTPSADEE